MLVSSMPHHPTRSEPLQGAYFLPLLSLHISQEHLSVCAVRLKTGDSFGLTHSGSRALAD
jgi:hypothetical protein